MPERFPQIDPYQAAFLDARPDSTAAETGRALAVKNRRRWFGGRLRDGVAVGEAVDQLTTKVVGERVRFLGAGPRRATYSDAS
jgi:hypothetical protein